VKLQVQIFGRYSTEDYSSIESAAFNAYHHIIENTASPDFILDENGNKVWENDRISGISSYKELKVLAEIDR
jgi:hypothetical protein